MGDCISWCNPVFKRVETLPELDYATRNHAYITPDNKTYILNDNGDGFTELTSSATNSYDDAELKRRIQAVESRTDNFVNDVNVSREGNKVKITYNFVDKTSKEIEFEDNDTVTLAYDDTALKNRIKSLEDKPDKDTKYTTTGNGLSLNEDNQFYLDIKENIVVNKPYSSDIKKVNLSPSNRYTNGLESYLSYAIDNVGIKQNNLIMETGLLFDYTGSYKYKDITENLEGINLSTIFHVINSSYIQGDFSLTLSDNVKIEGHIFADWSDENNKVVISILAKLIWKVDQGYAVEHYEHSITKEELDSNDPIQIEITDGDNVVGALSVLLSNTGFFMNSTQNSVVAKDNTDSKYYYLERL